MDLKVHGKSNWWKTFAAGTWYMYCRVRTWLRKRKKVRKSGKGERIFNKDQKPSFFVFVLFLSEMFPFVPNNWINFLQINCFFLRLWKNIEKMRRIERAIAWLDISCLLFWHLPQNLSQFAKKTGEVSIYIYWGRGSYSRSGTEVPLLSRIQTLFYLLSFFSWQKEKEE